MRLLLAEDKDDGVAVLRICCSCLELSGSDDDDVLTAVLLLRSSGRMHDWLLLNERYCVTVVHMEPPLSARSSSPPS